MQKQRCIRLFRPFVSQADIWSASTDCPHMHPSGLKEAMPCSQQVTQVPISGGAQKQQKRRKSFSKRRKTLLRKSYELSQYPKARVYLFVEMNNQVWIYTSDPHDTSLPPSNETIVCIRFAIEDQTLILHIDTGVPIVEHKYTEGFSEGQ
jgi:hypothetical protein